MTTASNFKTQVHGHRGAAGHYPQNSIPGFLYAVDLGVDALELDIVISGDQQLVVSHEPFMAAAYVLTPEAGAISAAREKDLNLYKMEYSEIRQYDSGSKADPQYPQKKNIKTYKPLLTEVFETVENHISKRGLKTVIYSIEIKSVPGEYDLFQPPPESIIELLIPLLKKYRLEERVILQSFDVNLLNLLHARYSTFPISYLVNKPNPEKQLAKLDFTPDYYGAYFKLIRQEGFMDFLKARNIKVIAWTVNETEDIKEMLRLGVDAIVSDYPEKVLKQLQR